MMNNKSIEELKALEVIWSDQRAKQPKNKIIKDTHEAIIELLAIRDCR